MEGSSLSLWIIYNGLHGKLEAQLSVNPDETIDSIKRKIIEERLFHLPIEIARTDLQLYKEGGPLVELYARSKVSDVGLKSEESVVLKLRGMLLIIPQYSLVLRFQ